MIIMYHCGNNKYTQNQQLSIQHVCRLSIDDEHFEIFECFMVVIMSLLL